jgi:hypothetical protein
MSEQNGGYKYQAVVYLDLINKSGPSKNNFVEYNMSSSISANNPFSPNKDFEYTWDSRYKILTIKFRLTDSERDFTKYYYYGFGGKYADGYDASSVIITKNNEPIEYDYIWYGNPKLLKDFIKIKAENVIGLDNVGTGSCDYITDEEYKEIMKEVGIWEEQ